MSDAAEAIEDDDNPVIKVAALRYGPRSSKATRADAGRESKTFAGMRAIIPDQD